MLCEQYNAERGGHLRVGDEVLMDPSSALAWAKLRIAVAVDKDACFVAFESDGAPPDPWKDLERAPSLAPVSTTLDASILFGRSRPGAWAKGQGMARPTGWRHPGIFPGYRLAVSCG